MYKNLLRHLGSLRLAVILLAVLSVVLIWATFYEAHTSTESAVYAFYGSWWFCALLMLLGLNIASATLVRFPWKRSQYGFVLTHSGILFILLGAVVGLLGGREGYITLIENGNSVDSLTTGNEILQIERPEDKLSLRVPLNVRKLNAIDHPVPIQTSKLVDTDSLQISLVKRYVNTEERLIVNEGYGEFNPALLVSMNPQLDGEENAIKEWLLSGDPERQIMQIGPLLIRIFKADSEDKLKKFLDPSNQNGEEKGIFSFVLEGNQFDLPVQENIGKVVRLADDKISVELKEYFPDFRMDTESGKPVTVSQDPNNPVVYYEVTWKGESDSPCKAVGFVFADYPDLGMNRLEGADANSFEVSYDFDRLDMDVGIFAESSVVYLIAGPGEHLHYISRKPGEARQVGALSLNQIVPLEGWKMNPGLSVVRYVQSAESKNQIVPVPIDESMGFSRPALELKLSGSGYSTNVFVQWNRPFEIITAANTDSKVPVTFLYADEKIPLGFNIRLLKFNMPTFEGTDMPASYESLIRVTNKKTGEALERKIWMNHPMSYQGYRISQSGYSIGMQGRQSTLQLLADPGSWLKWLGSILMILGITLMYFWNPSERKKIIINSDIENEES